MIFPFITDKEFIFRVTVFLAALIYFFGGYWILKTNDGIKKAWLYIVAGIAYSSSLATLPFLIPLIFELPILLLPLINICFFTAIGICLVVNYKKKSDNDDLKPLFIRSLILLIVTSFFAYTPISFKPYRSIIILLNNGNQYLYSNIQMLNYTDEFEEAMNNNDYDTAVEKAKKANECGIHWLTAFNTNPKDEYRMIGLSFDNLYNAYSSKGYQLMKQSDYQNALSFYKKGDLALYAYDRNTLDWELEKAHSLNQLALCYQGIKEYSLADSLYGAAINKYQATTTKKDRKLAVIIGNLAESLSDQYDFHSANETYKLALDIFSNDSLVSDNNHDFIRNYHGLIKDYFLTDSLEQAETLIYRIKQIDNLDPIDKWKTNLYDGVYQYRLNRFKNSEKILNECLRSAKSIFKANAQNIAESQMALAITQITQANYSAAKKNLLEGIDITIKNYDTNSSRYANFLKNLAFLNKEQGNILVSERQFKEVLTIYSNELEECRHKLPIVLSEIASLELILGNFHSALQNVKSSLSMANDFIDSDSPSATPLLNNAAYVNYFVGNLDHSDSLYSKTISINEEFNLSKTASTAFALNGKGLIMTAKGKYHKADLFFKEALNLNISIFSEFHPYTAIIYLNYACLRMNENKINEAQDFLDKAFNISIGYFDKDNLNLADIYLTYGDLYSIKKETIKAKELYEKAINIYLNNFESDHYKIVEIRKTLQKI